MTDETIRYAQGFARLGYSVYPVNLGYVDGKKSPEFKVTNSGGDYIGGWKHGDYPTDPDEIAKQWEGYNGVAVNTGRSGLVVVDIDVKNGVDGFTNLDEFLRDNELVLPWTPLVVTTPSGGEHRYYRAGTIPVKSLQDALGENVDTRAVGGLAFAPPTQLGDTGTFYQFDETCPHVSELPVFPDTLAELLAGAGRSRKAQRKRGSAALSQADREFHTNRRAKALEQLSRLEPGNRHEPMLRLATTIFGSTAVLGESIDEYRELFLTAYRISGGDDEADADRVIRDVIKYVDDNPWESTFVELTGEFPNFLPESLRAEFMDRVQRKELDLAAAEIVKERQRERTYSQTVLATPISGEELLANKPDETLWLVEGLLHWEKTRATVIGQYKTGKSTLVLNLLHALTTGTYFLDRFAVRKPVKVAYMDLELGKSLAYQWLSKMTGLDRSNFVYYDLVGRGSQLDMRSDHLRRKWAQQLADDGVGLLIMDPMSVVYSALGVDEHGPEVRSVLDALDTLVATTGMHGVVVTDHAGHGDDTKTRARGHSSKMDWLTTRMSITRQGEDFDGERSFLSDWRGTDVSKGKLVLDERTNLLTLESTADAQSVWLDAQRGRDLTLAEAADALGVSERRARPKLQNAGWRNIAGARRAGIWVYSKPDAPTLDPFAA